MNIGDVFFTFRGDSQKLIADAKTGGDAAGTAGGTSFGARFKTAMTTGDFGSFIKGGFGLAAGLMVFGAITKGISAVGDIMGDAISKASDLEESQSKVNVVFGEGAVVVNAWADTAASAMGLSTQAALEAAGTFGNFIQALGSGREEAQAMSTDIVQLAADLGSFNNTGIDEVILALRSGLAGEAEPMRRLGVSLSAARVEAYILSKGLAATKAEITDSMKVTARYALIMEDTAMAQGDFARTSDGLANTQKRLGAEMDTALAKLGTVLLPLVAEFASFAADVIPAVADAIGNLGTAIADLNKWLDPNLQYTEDLTEAMAAVEKQAGLAPGTLDRYKASLDALSKAEREAQAAADLGKLEELIDIKQDLGIMTAYEVETMAGLTQERVEAALALERQLRAEAEALGLSVKYNALLMEMERRQEAAAFTGAALTENMQDFADATGETTKAIVKDWTWAGSELSAIVGKWPDSFRSAVLDGREQLEEAMFELRWAMERPFADDAFAKWLAARAREATSMMAKALRQGRPELVAEAAAIRIDLLEQLNIMDPGAGTQAALRQRGREMEGNIGGGGGPIRRSKPPKDRKQDTADETAYTSAVIGTSNATDKRTASVDRSTAADKKHEEAIKAKEKALKAEQAAADRLSAAFDYMADSSMPDLQAESTAALEALRLSLEAQASPLKTLRAEEEALAALRRQAMDQHRYDVVAAIDQRQEEIDLQQKQIKLISERYAMEDAALDRIQAKMGVSIERARELLAIYRDKEKYEDYTDRQLANVIVQRRHSGGPVTGGMPYWVGKTGAEELFVPKTSGTMVPQGAVGGAQSTVRVELAPGTGHELQVAGMTEGGFASLLAGILRGSTSQPRYGWSG